MGLEWLEKQENSDIGLEYIEKIFYHLKCLSAFYLVQSVFRFWQSSIGFFCFLYIFGRDEMTLSVVCYFLDIIVSCFWKLRINGQSLNESPIHILFWRNSYPMVRFILNLVQFPFQIVLWNMIGWFWAWSEILWVMIGRFQIWVGIDLLSSDSVGWFLFSGWMRTSFCFLSFLFISVSSNRDQNYIHYML